MRAPKRTLAAPFPSIRPGFLRIEFSRCGFHNLAKDEASYRTTRWGCAFRISES